MTKHKLPPPSYFEKVKTKEDWHTLDCQGYMPAEWASSFPSDYPTHKAISRMYKQSLKKGVNK
jgi:hypothetical protein